MHKILKYAAIAGVLSLIILIPFIVLEVFRGLNKLGGGLISLYTLYIFVLLAILILYIIFIWGFKILGEKYQNNLLKIASYILIVVAIIYSGYAVLASIFPAIDNTSVHIITLVIMGAAMIPFGIGLLRLKTQFGSVATAAGVIEIISGISFLTILLSIIGILLHIPLNILLVIILFRAIKKLEMSPTI